GPDGAVADTLHGGRAAETVGAVDAVQLVFALGQGELERGVGELAVLDVAGIAAYVQPSALDYEAARLGGADAAEANRRKVHLHLVHALAITDRADDGAERIGRRADDVGG